MSPILRRHLIASMLDVIDEYKYCSAACHEAIEVLDILKVAFDDDDIETLKAFVKANLSSKGQTHYTFASGRQTTNSNLATIIKIGIALKRITQSAAHSSNEEDGEEVLDSQSEDDKPKMGGSGSATGSTKSFNHLADKEWTTFVDTKLNKFETKWTKKLESYTESDHADHEEVNVMINDSDSDDDMQLPLGVSKSVIEPKLESMFDQDLGGDKRLSKDDQAILDKEYLAN